ncbi:MAG: peptidylprolyl isomerase [Acidobacteria bacterium]|nr:peptidylprolyl isomerase [Acidobacteriota bacterium]
MRRAGRSGRLALLALATLAAAGCGGRDEPAPAAAPAPRAEALTEAQLDRYLLRETGLDPRSIDPAARIRLREELVAEALFADAAEAQGLYAPIDAIDDGTRRLIALGAAGTPEELRADARRRVLAQIYEMTVLLPEVQVDDAEVERELAASRPADRGEQVTFRQLLVDSRVKANAALERLQRGRETFQDVAGQVSQAPDRGAVQVRQLSQLPEPAARVLKKLKPGELSRPVEIEGSYYLFRLEDRRPPPGPGVREREAARERVFERKFGALRAARIQALAAAAAAPAPAP